MQPTPSVHGKWVNTMEQLMSYRYLGCRSEMVDEMHAVGRMPLRSDMRRGAGLLGTPLAIAMLDTAGINIDRIVFGALTHVAVNVVDDAVNVRVLRTDGEVARLAQRAVFTEAVMSDGDDPTRILAHGSADWVNLGAVAPGFDYTDPGPGVPDEPPMPPLHEAYFVERDGTGAYRIPVLRAEIGDQLLHHGPNLVALESHANELASVEASGADVGLRNFDVRFIRGGNRPPFVTRARGSGRSGNRVWARAELVDEGGSGQVISRIHTTHEVVTR